MSRAIEDERVAGRVREVKISGIVRGFISRRGRAETKYQYHGEVPMLMPLRFLERGRH